MLVEDILALIPQRPPFVFIDSLLQADESVTRSQFLIREDQQLVQNGWLSEIALIENIAQTAAAGTGYRATRAGSQPGGGYLGGVRNFAALRLPKVDEQLTTEITVIASLAHAQKVQGRVFVNSEEIASCELQVFLQQ